MPLTQKIDDIMDRSTGDIDRDFLTKPRKPTTRMEKPFFFAVPELPWKRNDGQPTDGPADRPGHSGHLGTDRT